MTFEKIKATGKRALVGGLAALAIAGCGYEPGEIDVRLEYDDLRVRVHGENADTVYVDYNIDCSLDFASTWRNGEFESAINSTSIDLPYFQEQFNLAKQRYSKNCSCK